jgi:uncharacterized protein YbjT (DUF2867 family)
MPPLSSAFAPSAPVTVRRPGGASACARRARPTPQQRRSSVASPNRRPTVAQSSPAAPPPPPPDDDPAAAGQMGAVQGLLAGLSRAAGLGRPARDDGALFDVDRGQDLFDRDDEPPEVLVAGATGETGRIVVRKLLLRGYKVRVLVRDLFSSTLDLLGTGVSFVKGDLSDHDALLDCVGDVDKVVCAVGPTGDQAAEAVDFRGVVNLISAFQDSRVMHYGRSEATKLRLFDFSRDRDVEKWRVVPPAPDAFGGSSARVNFTETTRGRKVFLGRVFGIYDGQAEMRTVPAKISLRGFSGLILRVIGDGKPYRFVLRTAGGAKEGVEYVVTFATRRGKWETIRLPISSFVARNMSDDAVRKDAIKLSRGDVRQMALQYRKPEESPEKDDGQFYLGVDYIKTYRTQDEPDFVLVSCASVTGRDAAALEEAGLRELAADDSSAWKYLAEKRLRNSGLTYTIVRPGAFTDQPGGNKALMLEQGGDVSGVISRADLAEICVKALLDPRACNVTFDAFESMYAPTAKSPIVDMSSLLGLLRPNT